MEKISRHFKKSISRAKELVRRLSILKVNGRGEKFSEKELYGEFSNNIPKTLYTNIVNRFTSSGTGVGRVHKPRFILEILEPFVFKPIRESNPDY